jgi:hypothetical protein
MKLAIACLCPFACFVVACSEANEAYVDAPTNPDCGG